MKRKKGLASNEKNTRKLKILLIFLSLFLILLSSHIFAEIAPQYYARYQRSAPYHLKILVLKVDKGFCLQCENQNIAILGEVSEVYRQPQDFVDKNANSINEIGNSAKVRIKQKISIQYKHFWPPRGWVGPRPVPIFKERQSYDAFLSFDGKKNVFHPAARGYSFESLIHP